MEGVPDRHVLSRVHAQKGGGDLGPTKASTPPGDIRGGGASRVGRRSVRRVGLSPSIREEHARTNDGGAHATAVDETVPARKRMGCREARRALVRPISREGAGAPPFRRKACGVRVAVRSMGARLDTGVDGRRWLHASLAGLRLRSRKRARKAGTARSERSLRGRVGPNLGIASRRGPCRVHGLVVKVARPCRRTARESDPTTNGCTGTRFGITAEPELPPRWPRERSTRATRRKASRRGARGLSPSPRVMRLAVCGSAWRRACHGITQRSVGWSRTIAP